MNIAGPDATRSGQKSAHPTKKHHSPRKDTSPATTLAGAPVMLWSESASGNASGGKVPATSGSRTETKGPGREYRSPGSFADPGFPAFDERYASNNQRLIRYVCNTQIDTTICSANAVCRREIIRREYSASSTNTWKRSLSVQSLPAAAGKRRSKTHRVYRGDILAIAAAFSCKHQSMKTLFEPTKLKQNRKGNHQQFGETLNQDNLTTLKVILCSRS